jgi:hypothetical protein
MHSCRSNYVRCDVGKFRQVEHLFEKHVFDFVCHAAAEYGRWNGEDYYENLWLTNAETVQLAREAKASILLADEEEVRELAAGFGLEVRGCLGLLAEAVRRELISIKEAKQDAKRLIEEGYRISEEVLKEFYTMLGSEESN